MALALIATGHTGGLGAVGATIWIVARILYLPIYVMGVIYVRTALWGVAVIGVLMMLVRRAWSVARPSRMMRAEPIMLWLASCRRQGWVLTISDLHYALCLQMPQ